MSGPQRRDGYGAAVARMTGTLHHRGPDAQQALLLDGVALGHTRLAIVDLSGGAQPMRDPATGVSLVFNGEVFNHLELRAGLEGGHAFRTHSDTEVILAAYLARGIDCVRELIGQFAFAVWDPRDRSLHLARDHVGICPLYYAVTEEGLSFASEVKALFASGRVVPALDPLGLDETLHLWSPVAPRTSFQGVHTLPPGCVARFSGRSLTVRRYWELDLDPQRVDPTLTGERAVDAVGALLEDAVRLRLRADVPVAAYLSGGVDSSVVCAIAQRQLGGSLQTFSVAFAQARYDEAAYQQEVAGALATLHRTVRLTDAEIGALLPDVVEHGEQALIRSAPAPFLRLSRWVRECQTKVVLTGEGSDEIFWGYDLFKETQVRQFWARRPESPCRPQLLRRLYPYLPLAGQPTQLLRQFYGQSLEAPNTPAFSHLIRWENTGRVARFYAPAFAARVGAHDAAGAAVEAMTPASRAWPPLCRAQALEMQTLLSGYLLSAQGDRMLLGGSVEGRFPFLDHRLMELAARLPPSMKLRGLTEKFVLRRYARRCVPKAVWERHKFPYRAPIAEAIVGPGAPAWAAELLAPPALAAVGVFDPIKVGKLVAKLRRPGTPSEADNMALMAVASTQLLHARLIGRRWADEKAPPIEVRVQ